MSSVNQTDPESSIELTRHSQKRWFKFHAYINQNVDSPSSSGRFLFSSDPGWLNLFSRLPATPARRSAEFEDIPLDAGSELIPAHPSGQLLQRLLLGNLRHAARVTNCERVLACQSRDPLKGDPLASYAAVDHHAVQQPLNNGCTCFAGPRLSVQLVSMWRGDPSTGLLAGRQYMAGVLPYLQRFV